MTEFIFSILPPLKGKWKQNNWDVILVFNSTYSQLLHTVNYVYQESFREKHYAIWQWWLTKDK